MMEHQFIIPADVPIVTQARNYGSWLGFPQALLTNPEWCAFVGLHFAWRMMNKSLRLSACKANCFKGVAWRKMLKVVLFLTPLDDCVKNTCCENSEASKAIVLGRGFREMTNAKKAKVDIIYFAAYCYLYCLYSWQSLQVAIRHN